MNTNTSFESIDGVLVSMATRSKFAHFEEQYLAVRDKEKRILNLDEIRNLPFVSPSSPDHLLWKIRRKNLSRFFKYISAKKGLNILDVGCGNGFFSNAMQQKGNYVTGLDVNFTELKQAAAAFPLSGVKWICADILNDALPKEKYELITFCCSFQYFGEPELILERCKQILSPGGEIHIIDSPFYTEQSWSEAKTNSEKYYQQMGVGSMSSYYFHHTLDVFKNFNYSVLYRPKKLLAKLFNDSPFLWLVVKV